MALKQPVSSILLTWMLPFFYMTLGLYAYCNTFFLKQGHPVLVNICSFKYQVVASVTEQTLYLELPCADLLAPEPGPQRQVQ